MNDVPPTACYQLTEDEAMKAMHAFLALHGEHQDTSSDLVNLLARGADGFLVDPPVWIDWVRCIRKVKGLDASEEAALSDAVAGGGWLGRESAARLASLASRDIPER